jgi:hypothetical protein
MVGRSEEIQMKHHVRPNQSLKLTAEAEVQSRAAKDEIG